MMRNYVIKSMRSANPNKDKPQLRIACNFCTQQKICVGCRISIVNIKITPYKDRPIWRNIREKHSEHIDTKLSDPSLVLRYELRSLCMNRTYFPIKLI